MIIEENFKKIFQKKYEDLLNSKTNLANFHYSFLESRHDVRVNKLLNPKFFNKDYIFETEFKSIDNFFLNIKEIVDTCGGYKKFPNIKILKNGFQIYKNFSISFGKWEKKIFGGEEFKPSYEVDINNSNPKFSVKKDNNFYILCFNNTNAKIPDIDLHEVCRDENFDEFLILIINKICNFLADDLFIHEFSQTSNWNYKLNYN